MKFDIDVSGEDILSPNFTVCVANNNIVKGFKMSAELVAALNERYSQGNYKYKGSKSGRANFRVRLYCIIVYHLFEDILPEEEIELDICRDFNGKEHDTETNFNYFLKDILEINIREMRFTKLENDSPADTYAYIMRKDTKNKLDYVGITLDNLEEFLRKK